MRRTAVLMTAFVAVCVAGANGQVIAFNGPMPWTTQRNDSITVRAQIDTAQLKKKRTIVLSAVLVNDRQQKTVLVKKTFPVADYTGEFSLGQVKRDLVGGRSYVKIEWSLPGVNNGKGDLMPVGIVALDKLLLPGTITVARVKDGADAAAVASMNNGDYRTAGAANFGFAWNKEALFIVLIKKAMQGTVRFAIDGKNGKNAFLSFADRAILYQPDKNSLRGVHFSRAMVGNGLKYEEKPWTNEITNTAVDDKVVIRVPWYDAGLIPFEERRFGMGIMTFDAKGTQTAAMPAQADFFCPGTWCNLLLAK
jgi:hypothetical protein